MERQKGNSRLYDLWECEDNNLQNKRIKSTRYIPSILPPVALPDEGISYNPPLGSYLDFLGKVVKEEEKISTEEERVERKIRPNDDEFFNFGGLKEDLKFTIEGPLSIGEVKTEVEEPVENKEIKIEEKDNEKLRTRLRLKKKKNLKQIQNSTTKVVDNQKKIQKQQLQSLKSLTKIVNSEHAQHLNKIKLKNKQWKIKNLTTRKKLGRGKFEPYEEPVITPKELPASLRCLTS
uniref:Ribosome biogenesis protein NOP53 n=1 Tax=Meloidogyne incognita TaxID=6306 RepID=A0A914MVF4_MELIC